MASRGWLVNGKLRSLFIIIFRNCSGCITGKVCCAQACDEVSRRLDDIEISIWRHEMDLLRESARLSSPKFVASPIRKLSRDEIEDLLNNGQITPVGLIPQSHAYRRDSIPASRKRYGSY